MMDVSSDLMDAPVGLPKIMLGVAATLIAIGISTALLLYNVDKDHEKEPKISPDDIVQKGETCACYAAGRCVCKLVL